MEVSFVCVGPIYGGAPIRDWHEAILPSHPLNRRLSRAAPAILPIIFLVLSITLSTTATSQLPVKTVQATPSPTTPFKYVVTIVEENQPVSANFSGTPIGIVGNPTDAPYLNNVLIPNGALAMNYHSTSHDGSLAQYIGMISGNSRCFDNSPDPNGGNPCLISGDTIVDRVEASGRTWKAFMEDYPDCINYPSIPGCNTNGCFMNLWWAGYGQYLANHNPFLYFPQIISSKDRCSNIVPANTVPAGYTKFEAFPDLFLKHLNSTSPANYIFMVPNHCDSFHGPFYNWQCDPYNCPGMQTNTAPAIACLHAQVQAGDAYLRKVVTKILNSTLFQTGEAALFVTFDEPNSHPTRDPVCNNPTNVPPESEACPILGLWVGGSKGAVKERFNSNNFYNHYSYLKTIESAWQLAPLTTNDTKASPMLEFFTRSFPPPIGTFSFTPTNPVTGDTVTFTVDGVTGAGPPYKYTWMFGDGSTSGGQTVYHSYNIASNFTAKLNVTDPQGQSGISGQTVTVTDPLTSYLSYTPQSLNVGTLASFTSHVSGGKGPYNYNWDFGDGVKDSGINPTHAYRVAASYTVRLAVTDALQHASSSAQILTISVMTVSFTIDSVQILVGDRVSFVALVNGGTGPYQYDWGFGDGATGVYQSVTHSYSSDGNFAVTVTITDAANRFAKIQRQITVNPIPLGTVTISLDSENPAVGDQLRLSGQVSGGTAPYTYRWDFGDLSTSTEASVIHSFSTDGVFGVRLNVTDASNHVQTKTVTRSVSVLRALCAIANPCNIISPAKVNTAGQTTIFSATVVGGLAPYHVTWFFGDGKTGTGETVSHAYASGGFYTIKLIVQDSAGHSYTTLTTLNVDSQPQQFSLLMLGMIFASGVAISAIVYTFRSRILRQFRD